MRSPENTSARARTRTGIEFENANEDNFVLPSWQIFAVDFVVTLCAQARTILSTFRRSFARPNRRR